jgi:hypothetical protein
VALQHLDVAGAHHREWSHRRLHRKALRINDLHQPGRAAGRNSLVINHLRKTLFKKRAKSAVKHKKNIFLIIKNHCIFARLCYSLSMTEKEKEIQALEEKLEQIANDLIDPMLDDQTTVLLHAMRKVREKINALVAE